MKKPTLLLVTNTAKAKVYDINGFKYSRIEELEHPQSRLKAQQLTSDSPGNYQSRKFIPASDPHKQEHIHFAKVVAEFIKEVVDKKHYKQVILCAEPYFYGLLRQFFTSVLKSLVVKVIEKDYIPLPEHKLNETIEAIIHEPF
ncbi:protein required for attachment to host cells [Allofrancisella inopinata]|uniref:Host attachment protein n=1 Tax=Allofrancisella inopinata TaxID=1085647 RepID=A0AAE7CQS0_9GAMM|nr:host attachment protein [Allofrancisella inopinata]QIV95624.1 host attachment protein [Allofrancisella inopinata]TDT70686.1 protein required for attachment to host cells [Allofrancisella inopinata]